MLLLFILVVVAATEVHSRKEGCRIDMEQLPKHTPLILRPSIYEVIHPDEDNLIYIKPSTNFLLVCPSGRNSYSHRPMMFVSCSSANKLIHEGLDLNIYQIECKYDKYEQIVKSGNTCSKNGVELQVGAQIDPKIHFLSVFNVCFNETSRSLIYTKMHLCHPVNNKRTDDLVYKIDQDILQYAYEDLVQIVVPDYQRQRLNNLVGLPEDSEKYITTDYYLRNTPLIKTTEYDFSFMKNATYRMLNGAFVWYESSDQFAKWDWDALTPQIEDLSRKLDAPLDIYSGIHGVTTLPHEKTKEEIELTLIDENGTGVFNVPALLWKLVHEPKENRAVVFVISNKHRAHPAPHEPVCPPINQKIKWADIFYLGEMFYACDYNEALKVIPEIPSVPYEGVLV